MKQESLGEAFRACYYARDPEMLQRLIDRAKALEVELAQRKLSSHFNESPRYSVEGALEALKQMDK